MSSWKPINTAYSVTEPTTGLDDKLAPIILLHGMTCTRHHWDEIDQPLADLTHRKVYKLDARNHGGSEWSEEFDFDILCDDVNHFMKEHSIPKAVLIGHSMGGRTAMEVAGKYPDKVEKLIIEDMTPLGIEADFVTGMTAFLQMKEKCLNLIPPDTDITEGKRIIREFLLDKVMEILKDSSNERTREKYQIDIDLEKNDKGEFRWKTNYELINNGKCVPEMLRKEFDKVFDGDVLFICGPKSLFRIINDKDRIVQKFPKAKFEEIRDATHSVHAEYPEDYVRHCGEFIQKS